MTTEPLEVTGLWGRCLVQRLSVAASFVVALVGCGATPTAPSDVSRAELASAPARIVSDGVALTLTAFLTRDFMPISPPDGKPLGGVLRIKTENGTPVPTGIAVSVSWIIFNSETWAASVEQRPRAETGPNYEVIVRDGPKCPDVMVDVVVRVRDSAGAESLLWAPKQLIIGTR
jgi:hypothetical protein